MGVDLTLLPDIWPSYIGAMLAYERIALDRDHDLYAAIDDRHPHKLDRAVKWYGDGGIEEGYEDRYGKSLTWLLPHDFEAILKSGIDLSQKNQAAIRYAASLKPDTKIVLWWH